MLGPTASGKESASFALAPRLDAEIVSVDSMKIYRGLDIGTAKASQEMREAVAASLSGSGRTGVCGLFSGYVCCSSGYGN